MFSEKMQRQIDKLSWIVESLSKMVKLEQNIDGFEGKAIVTMEEVVEHLYNRECQGRIVIDDTLKEAIDQYYKQYGCN